MENKRLPPFEILLTLEIARLGCVVAPCRAYFFYMKQPIIINPEFITDNELTLRESFWLAVLYAYAKETYCIILPTGEKYYQYTYRDIVEKLPYTFKGYDVCRHQMKNLEKKGIIIRRKDLGINHNIDGFTFTKKLQK